MITLLLIIVTLASVVFYLHRPTVITKLYVREIAETPDGVKVVHNFYNKETISVVELIAKVWK